MNYELINSSNNDIERLIKYKKKTIYEYAKNLSEEEINRINNYVSNNVPKLLNDYFNIVINNNVIGCVLVTNTEDGKLLDEIYIEEQFRNNGVGTDIIKNIIKENDIVYLWVYKENIQAISLYKRLGFKVIDETDSRYYMKDNKDECIFKLDSNANYDKIHIGDSGILFVLISQRDIENCNFDNTFVDWDCC